MASRGLKRRAGSEDLQAKAIHERELERPSTVGANAHVERPPTLVSSVLPSPAIYNDPELLVRPYSDGTPPKSREELEVEESPIEDLDPDNLSLLMNLLNLAEPKPKVCSQESPSHDHIIPPGHPEALEGVKVLFHGDLSSLDRETAMDTVKSYGELVSKPHEAHCVIIGRGRLEPVAMEFFLLVPNLRIVFEPEFLYMIMEGYPWAESEDEHNARMEDIERVIDELEDDPDLWQFEIPPSRSSPSAEEKSDDRSEDKSSEEKADKNLEEPLEDLSEA